MSFPSSATPSIRSQVPTPTVSPPPKAASHAPLPQVNSSTLRNKLKNMFDPSHSAVFDVSVVIHELGNVPQLDGQFSVKWKFRGRRPHDADRMLEHPVQRKPIGATCLPMGHNRPLALRHSSSALSLRTASTTSASTTSPTWSTNINRLMAPHVQPPTHHSSLPPPVISPVSSSNIDLLHRERKATDPTPLRQSTRPNAKDEPRFTVEEPHEILGTLDDSGSGSRPSDEEPHGSRATFSSTAEPLSIDEASTTKRSIQSLRSSSLYQALGTSKAPSIVSTIDSLRAPSRSSSHSDKSIPSVVVSGHSHSATYPSLQQDSDSDERKGRTPTKSIRAHAVAWEYKIRHCIRVPLGKNVEVASTGRHHHQNWMRPNSLPILGGGALSESSLKLDIEQVDHRGEGMKTPAGHDIMFGYVNIDLAPFADLGPVTRKFLLKNSKTNATIRVTVDMRYIGGEQNWVAPPMAEGHMSQGISELTGEEIPQLFPTVSISSNSDISYHSSAAVTTGSSRSSPCVNTVGSLGVSSTKHRYHTYEHHLLPDATVRPAQRQSPPELQPSSGSQAMSWSHSGTASDFAPSVSSPFGGVTSSPMASPPLVTHSFTASPESAPLYLPSSPSAHSSLAALGPAAHSRPARETSPGLAPIMSRSSVYPSLSPVSINLDTPSDSPHSALLSPDLPSGFSQHHSHAHYLRDRDDTNQLHPDVVIESVFNPKPADEYTPFTYVPDVRSVAGDAQTEELGDNDDEDDGDFASPLHADMTTMLHTSSHSHWKRMIRRRVASTPHRQGS